MEHVLVRSLNDQKEPPAQHTTTGNKFKTSGQASSTTKSAINSTMASDGDMFSSSSGPGGAEKSTGSAYRSAQHGEHSNFNSGVNIGHNCTQALLTNHSGHVSPYLRPSPTAVQGHALSTVSSNRSESICSEIIRIEQQYEDDEDMEGDEDEVEVVGGHHTSGQDLDGQDKCGPCCEDIEKGDNMLVEQKSFTALGRLAAQIQVSVTFELYISR